MLHHLLHLAFDNLFIYLHAFEEQEHEGQEARNQVEVPLSLSKPDEE
jgi:hypothetical protein